MFLEKNVEEEIILLKKTKRERNKIMKLKGKRDNEAIINSKIPDKTDPEPFRDYLYELRMKELNDKL